MTNYIVLLRGINVGGKNKMPMADLKRYLEEEGFDKVITYIQSGNVVLQSNLNAKTIKQRIEKLLPEKFKLDTSIIKVLVLTHDQLESIISQKPKGFGEEPEKYHSDVIFLMDIDSTTAFSVFSPKEGVDTVWVGDGVIYSQRLSAERTKSKLNKVIATQVYKSMTIRNWNTTTKLLELIHLIN